MHKDKITREMRRQIKEENNAFKHMMKICNHFFKDLFKQLKSVDDPRHSSYITYNTLELLLTTILANLMTIKTITGVTEKFGNKRIIDNFKKIVRNYDLSEFPHHDTINDFLEKLDVDQLLKIRTTMIKQLLKKRSFEKYRFFNNGRKYWLISVDATGTHSFSERHCEHCLTRKHVNKETGKVSYTYYHNVLEAKLVLGKFVFSIGTEFIENEASDVSKQVGCIAEQQSLIVTRPCELNAFKRLEKRIKKDFSRLPICILADSLYSNSPVMDICKANRWEYIIRFKVGSIKTLGKEFEKIKSIEKRVITEKSNGITKSYTYVNNLFHNSHKLSIGELIEEKYESKNNKESKKVVTFRYISSLEITKNNIKEIVKTGRKRWKIENEGFNTQKNHGYEIQHLKSKDVNAMKNHYILIQISHIIRQLYDNDIKATDVLKLSIKNESEYLLSCFARQLTDTELKTIETCKIQARFL